ncbi:tyrosine-protein phosphatase [Corynebacterium variabile]|uniref:tyrosine-protein phosphatase n=1 Tax=Corynebacterium variabile TaxID=1727 RepID=UPI003735A1A9
MDIPGLPNFRDLGGHRTSHGTVIAPGLLFRSVDLSRLEPAGGDALGDLGIRRVIDLRTTAEIEKRPDLLPDGMSTVHLDVLADSGATTGAQMAKVLGDPRRLNEILGGGAAVERMTGTYRNIVNLPSALRSYRELFLGVAGGGESTGGVLFHCTTGKDRTGWAAASLMLLLGVDEDAVTEDYLRTNTDLLPALQPVLDRFAEQGGDPDALLPVLGVREEYLRTALAEVDALFGGIHGYTTDGLGLTEQDLDRLTDAVTVGV